jgi:hypothetical protein
MLVASFAGFMVLAGQNMSWGEEQLVIKVLSSPQFL